MFPWKSDSILLINKQPTIHYTKYTHKSSQTIMSKKDNKKKTNLRSTEYKNIIAPQNSIVGKQYLHNSSMYAQRC